MIKRRRFVIIAAQFNRDIAQSLIRGATDVLRQAGVTAGNINILWVPGAFELPVVARHLAARRNHPDAIIAVGALIRGETSQHEVIAHAVAQGLADVSVRSGVPVTFGVIVANSLSQARARAGGAVGNRGAEAAMAALAVLRLFERLP